MGDVKDNGGAAFPNPALADENYKPQPGDEGMTLRDWFAGQALSGLLADPGVNAAPKPVATVCYQYAEAMIAARKGGDA